MKAMNIKVVETSMDKAEKISLKAMHIVDKIIFWAMNGLIALGYLAIESALASLNYDLYDSMAFSILMLILACAGSFYTTKIVCKVLHNLIMKKVR